ncbi:hypothetical protein DM02DRAFT_722852 [Periconia macrospinosa]|uniref:Uncharacterized protein n=1 Tax=Periconia macrospinosa TaxID=97972 RepID=A0A2V1EDI6_9PLEO|nr:hypothetical protein DM02DRAFT_722852 [Periconia macrospinosa]
MASGSKTFAIAAHDDDSDDDYDDANPIPQEKPLRSLNEASNPFLHLYKDYVITPLSCPCPKRLSFPEAILGGDEGMPEATSSPPPKKGTEIRAVWRGREMRVFQSFRVWGLDGPLAGAVHCTLWHSRVLGLSNLEAERRKVAAACSRPEKQGLGRTRNSSGRFTRRRGDGGLERLFLAALQACHVHAWPGAPPQGRPSATSPSRSPQGRLGSREGRKGDVVTFNSVIRHWNRLAQHTAHSTPSEGGSVEKTKKTGGQEGRLSLSSVRSPASSVAAEAHDGGLSARLRWQPRTLQRESGL